MIVRTFNPIERGPAIWLDEPLREAVQVARLLRRLGEYPDGADPVDIVIMGKGGNSGVGLEMYTALREHPRRKRVTILEAASMHALIAMAGDVVRIVEGGTIFLHDVGYATDYLLNEVPAHHTAAGLKALARRCEATDALHRRIFARRTGLDPERIATLRATDTTLDAPRAVAMGFADEVVAWPS